MKRMRHARTCPRHGMLPEDVEYAHAFPEEYVCDCGTLEARAILHQGEAVFAEMRKEKDRGRHQDAS